jgi:FAD:protein FMN transferase
MTEFADTFPCFGSTCSVRVMDDAPAVARARDQLLEWHARFSRFEPDSELSRLNRDARGEIVVGRTMARLVAAVLEARAATGGLVDGTLAGEIEAAGYRATLGAPLPLAVALRLAPPRRSARPREQPQPLELEGLVLRRGPGVAIDSGGLAKGLFADLLADELDGATFAIECAGDLRVGGAPREIHVASPFGGTPLHTFALSDAGVATSGIGRRSWLGRDGRPAHHLLDPASGRPAFTGVVQATAIAPTALEAEWRAKAAVLAGPARARDWLAHGGVVVFDDGGYAVVSAAADANASNSRSAAAAAAGPGSGVNA